MTLSDYQQATRPKVQGTRNLHELLSPSTLDFFILLSSCAGLIGNRGQANYASACTFQDAFARHRTGSLGLPTRSLDLGMIESAGYVSENLDSLRFLTAQGFTPVKLSEFFALLGYAISNPVNANDIVDESSQLVVGLTRLDKATLPSSTFHNAMFSHLVTSSPTPVSAADEEGSSSSSSSSLQHAIRSAPSVAVAHALVTGAIVEKVAQVLVVPVEDISSLRAISSYGGDSLAAVELRNWFVSGLQANVGVMEILGGKSIEALAADVVARSKLVSVVVVVVDDDEKREE